MLVRIVKMTFAIDKIETFKNRFQDLKDKIIMFDGCEFLELYQDKNRPEIFFTYSYWTSEANLNEYRNSDFFKEVWKDTKQMFTEKPEAWSVDKIVSLENRN